jgi:hypothetical protein
MPAPPPHGRQSTRIDTGTATIAVGVGRSAVADRRIAGRSDFRRVDHCLADLVRHAATGQAYRWIASCASPATCRNSDWQLCDQSGQ